MKILYLIPYNPVNPAFGGALRIYHILNHLCSHHDVTVAGFSTPEKEKLLVEQFPVLAGKTHFVQQPYSTSNRLCLFKSLFTSHSHWHHITRSEQLQKIIDKILEDDTFDIIQSEFPVMAMFHFNSNAIQIIDSHNVEYDNFKRMTKVKNPFKKLFYHIESHKFYKEETKACSEQDALLVTSERDIAIFEQSVPGVPKYLIPNGVDATYFQPFKTFPIPHSMVFVGMMKYVPNYDGINFFLDEIFPKIVKEFPNSTVTIVGKNPPKSIARRAGKNIFITGFVEDTRPYIQNASVYIVPLRMGGGTRLKIIEALAMKKPIVTTSIGCEGIDVAHGQTALIADEPQDFADAVMQLFNSKKLSSMLTENGYNLMKKYRWESIGLNIDEAYKELTGRKSKTLEANTETLEFESKRMLEKS